MAFRFGRGGSSFQRHEVEMWMPFQPLLASLHHFLLFCFKVSIISDLVKAGGILREMDELITSRCVLVETHQTLLKHVLLRASANIHQGSGWYLLPASVIIMHFLMS